MAAQKARPSDSERRPNRSRRHDLHQMVRAGKLHRGPRLVHDRTASRPLGAVDRDRAGRPELPAQGDADDRRVLQEERLLDLFLRQVAPGRQARPMPINHGFDTMKNFVAYYSGVYAYTDTIEVVPPRFPRVNPQFQTYLSEQVNSRVGRRDRPTGEERRQDHLSADRDHRRGAGGRCGQLHQDARAR